MARCPRSARISQLRKGPLVSLAASFGQHLEKLLGRVTQLGSRLLGRRFDNRPHLDRQAPDPRSDGVARIPLELLHRFLDGLHHLPPPDRSFRPHFVTPGTKRGHDLLEGVPFLAGWTQSLFP